MESRSCDETCCHEQCGEKGQEPATRPRTGRRLLLIVVGGTMAIVATLVAAILAPPFGANTTGLIVALAATLSAVTIVSTLAIPYLAVCLVGLLKGRRPSFQLHLSTCIALMFLASLLLWANLAHDFQGWPIVGKNGSWSFPVAAWHQSLAEPPGCLLVWSLNISACVAMLGGTAIILETLTVRRKEGVKKI